MHNVAHSRQDYTIGDYNKLPEGSRIELLNGQFFNMAPAPSTNHQLLLSELHYELLDYIKKNNRKCLVFTAPFDVFLIDPHTKKQSAVQPDISVICDKSKIDNKGCYGVPDLIIEIVSPSNASTDYIKKTAIYEANGVREYWIVNPIKLNIQVFILTQNGEYGSPDIYSFDECISVVTFAGLSINFKKIDLITP